MQPLDDNEARTALEEAADALFYEHGVVAVSMAQIRDRSGVSLRRLYSICPSKSDLVALWLRHSHRSWSADFQQEVAAGLAQGVPPVDAVFDALEAWMIGTGFRGCGFINTYAESSDLTDEHREIIRDHKRSLATYLETTIGRGDDLALLIDGAIVQAAIFGTAEPLRDARRIARLIADANF